MVDKRQGSLFESLLVSMSVQPSVLAHDFEAVIGLGFIGKVDDPICQHDVNSNGSGCGAEHIITGLLHMAIDIGLIPRCRGIDAEHQPIILLACSRR